MSSNFIEQSIVKGADFLDKKVSDNRKTDVIDVTNVTALNRRDNSGNTTEEISDIEIMPEPQPLTTKIDPVPYPIDALPYEIQCAVNEVHAFVKAPIPLVASSAISALSCVGQAHINIKRAEKLESPSSIYLLVIADSGERKTTVDSFFTKAIRDYQSEQAEAAKPEINRYEAELSAWNAERDGIITAIKGAGRSGKSTENLKSNLVEIQNSKPEPPRVPYLLLGDETPENLALRLAKEWPSRGVISSEAGLVLGSHGMGKDSIMRNLSLYNILWDGGTLEIGRKTSESFSVNGARLTVGLQIQEGTLRKFFEQSGDLARGTGFLARFLIAWPESTQGTRMYEDPPEHWPSLTAFNKRVREILEYDVPIHDGKLIPATLTLTSEAKKAWIEFHDTIEKELASGKELHDVRDVASKAGDNAARLAALFHVFNNGIEGQIDLDSFESASRIVAWHLHESRRFFGELALPIELADAARLDRAYSESITS
jgi:putative DNA primase/helicase